MNRIVPALLVLAVAGCGESAKELSNTELMYGNTGLPKNCRAIIKVNIDAWRAGSYTAEEVLGSIDRNCGEFGYSWVQ